MRKLILLFALIILMSCEKTQQPTQQCWICIDKYGVQPTLAEWESCDILEVTSQNGRRWKDQWDRWHLITCKIKE